MVKVLLFFESLKGWLMPKSGKRSSRGENGSLSAGYAWRSLTGSELMPTRRPSAPLRHSLVFLVPILPFILILAENDTPSSSILAPSRFLCAFQSILVQPILLLVVRFISSFDDEEFSPFPTARPTAERRPASWVRRTMRSFLLRLSSVVHTTGG